MDDRLPEGTLFGSYRIQGLVASGGMGQVYAAEHNVYGGAVAIKVLHPTLHADRGWRARFNEEGLVGTQLKHPHVLSARELVESEGRIALVLDLVRGGQTLEKVVSREFRDGLALVAALRVFLRILQGMDYLHDKKIVHGDLKPENVMIEGDFRRPVTWTPKVTDFGTVALIAHPVEIDGRPAVVATPRYASPEHLYGVDRIEVRSDIYCLGLILHFLLSGRHASNASNVREAAERVMLPVPIVNLVDLPEPVIEVFKRATDADPEDRFPTVRTMALAIRDVLIAVGADIDRADVAADIATEVDEDRPKLRVRGADSSPSQAATEPLTRDDGSEAIFGDSAPAGTGDPAPSLDERERESGGAGDGTSPLRSLTPEPAGAEGRPLRPAPRDLPRAVELSPEDVQEPIRKATPVPVGRARTGPPSAPSRAAVPVVAAGLAALVVLVLVVLALVAFVVR